MDFFYCFLVLQRIHAIDKYQVYLILIKKDVFLWFYGFLVAATKSARMHGRTQSIDNTQLVQKKLFLLANKMESIGVSSNESIDIVQH